MKKDLLEEGRLNFIFDTNDSVKNSANEFLETIEQKQNNIILEKKPENIKQNLSLSKENQIINDLNSLDKKSILSSMVFKFFIKSKIFSVSICS